VKKCDRQLLAQASTMIEKTTALAAGGEQVWQNAIVRKRSFQGYET
jgi:hypothetical protein